VNADVIVVGAGLAGLVATHELTAAGKRVALVDQESAANLGGQAFWSFGGLFLVDEGDLLARGGELVHGGQTGEAGADDDDVCVHDSEMYRIHERIG
jgi:choline dehydrogenase-like flavoprotein